MTDEKKYINRNNPVYISYAWANEDNPTIEKDVDALCKKLDDSGIFFKRDKEEDPDKTLIPYRWSIVDAAKEIGNGTVVLVFISKKFLGSLDCLRELYEIQKNGNTSERVFYFLLEGGEIREANVYDETVDLLNKKRDELIERIKQQRFLSDAEMYAIGNNMFVDNVSILYQDTRNNNSGDIKKFREKDFATVIEQIKKTLTNKLEGPCYETNGNEVSWKSFANCINKKNDSILLVGDYILKIDNESLGEYFDKIILQEATSQIDQNAPNLHEWYKRNYKENEIINQIKYDGFEKIIKEDKNAKINCDLLIDLLQSNHFSTIISIGYSKHISEVVIAYAKNKLQYWELNSETALFNQIEITKKDYDQTKNKYVDSFKDNSIQSENIKFYDLVRTTNRQSLVFSELDIVEFLHSCVVAMKDGSIAEGNKIQGSNFLALGTKLPNWSLRFIWCVFHKIVIKDPNTRRSRTALLNTIPIKDKNMRFLRYNGVLLVESEHTFSFIETIKSVL